MSALERLRTLWKVNKMQKLEKISYAKTVYGQEEIDAVVKCLSESTQMGNYSRQFEKNIALFLS